MTFLNNKWLGSVTGNQDVPEVRERMYDSCPDLGAFLNKMGAEGWELVAAYSVAYEHGVLEKFILKRAS